MRLKAGQEIGWSDLAPIQKKKKEQEEEKPGLQVRGPGAPGLWTRGHICLFGLNLSPELTQGQKGGDGSPDCLLTCGQEQSPHFLEKETGTIARGVSG